MKTTKRRTIGRLAQESGVGVETIRFYERKGILRRPPRTIGFREYAESDAVRIRFVRRAQKLGFTLKEIGELLSLTLRSGVTCGQVKNRTDAKLAEVEAKIRDLEQMRGSLQRLSEACGAEDVMAKNCRILECFESNGICQTKEKS